MKVFVLFLPTKKFGMLFRALIQTVPPVRMASRETFIEVAGISLRRTWGTLFLLSLEVDMSLKKEI